jgi:ArsR family transcriptional regulator, arsenate/arsenite/antimonite-responsive transcriptional repressor
MRDVTDEQTAVFRALADPTRLNLVKLLCRQHSPDALCVKALARLLGVSQPAISQHLRVLKGIGLVRGERRGYHIHYHIDAQGWKRCCDLIAAALRVEEAPEDSLKDYCGKAAETGRSPGFDR